MLQPTTNAKGFYQTHAHENIHVNGSMDALVKSIASKFCAYLPSADHSSYSNTIHSADAESVCNSGAAGVVDILCKRTSKGADGRWSVSFGHFLKVGAVSQFETLIAEEVEGGVRATFREFSSIPKRTRPNTNLAPLFIALSTQVGLKGASPWVRNDWQEIAKAVVRKAPQARPIVVLMGFGPTDYIVAVAWGLYLSQYADIALIPPREWKNFSKATTVRIPHRIGVNILHQDGSLEKHGLSDASDHSGFVNALVSLDARHGDGAGTLMPDAELSLLRRTQPISPEGESDQPETAKAPEAADEQERIEQPTPATVPVTSEHAAPELAQGGVLIDALAKIQQAEGDLAAEKANLFSRIRSHIQAGDIGGKKLLEIKETECRQASEALQACRDDMEILQIQLAGRERELLDLRALLSRRTGGMSVELESRCKELTREVAQLHTELDSSQKRAQFAAQEARKITSEQESKFSAERAELSKKLQETEGALKTLQGVLKQKEAQFISASDIAKGMVESFTKEFDAENEKLRAELSEKDARLRKVVEESARLKQQVERLAQKGAARSLVSLGCGEEVELYPGEHQDAIMLALDRAISNTADGRIAHILAAYRENSSETGAVASVASRVKNTLMFTRTFGKKELAELSAIGFSLDDTGPHLKLTFMGDPRYVHVMPRSGSDARGLSNSASDIIKMLTQ